MGSNASSSVGLGEFVGVSVADSGLFVGPGVSDGIPLVTWADEVVGGIVVGEEGKLQAALTMIMRTRLLTNSIGLFFLEALSIVWMDWNVEKFFFIWILR